MLILVFAGVFGATVFSLYGLVLRGRSNPVAEALKGFQRPRSARRFGFALEEWLRGLWRTEEDDLLPVGVALAAGGLALGLFFGPPAGALAAVLAFVFGPRAWAAAARQRLRRAFLARLPGVVNTMAAVLRAGGSVYQAVERVAEGAPPPVREEFARLKEEIDAVTPLGEALERLAKRVDVMEARVLADALKTAAEVGGGAAALDLLEAAAGFARERVRLREKVRAATSGIRYSFAAVTLCPPLFAAILAFAAPEYRAILLSERGRLLCLLAVCLMVAGHFWVHLLLKSSEKELGL